VLNHKSDAFIHQQTALDPRIAHYLNRCVPKSIETLKLS